jgi:hypothetical protein
MKNRTAVVASVLAFALAVAPAVAFAGGRHHGGGLIFGFANAVVATAVAVITAPVAILAAVAQAPLHYAPGPAYVGALPAYDTPAPGPRYYGRPAAPTYYGAPQTAPYYAPATVPADYTPPAATYYAPPRSGVLRPPDRRDVLCSAGGSAIQRAAPGFRHTTSGLPSALHLLRAAGYQLLLTLDTVARRVRRWPDRPYATTKQRRAQPTLSRAVAAARRE